MAAAAHQRTWPDDLIGPKQWHVYQRVIERAAAQGLRFAVGGGFAVATYTGHWRNTKDLDLYVMPADREAMIQVSAEAGLTDLYQRQPYDRRWIYRSGCGDTIVDIIWAMANLRAQVDEGWLRPGGFFTIRGERLPVVPAEEMIWNKLYVLQHDRCDWTDVFNILYASGSTVDWEYLLDRLGDDRPLLTGALSVYRWLCPGLSPAVPDWLWERLGLEPPRRDAIPAIDWHHSALLDVRPWFAVVEQR
jgi:hypothetical protein